MTALAAVVATAILLGLVAFQIALAAGAPLGRFAWGGQHPEKLPRNLRIGSAISCLVHAAFIAVALGAAGLIAWTPPTWLLWVITVFLALGIPMNALSRSRPERFTMTPIVVVLTACFAVLALTA